MKQNSNGFIDIIQQKGEELYRDMPWREDTRPYYVLVSELMLQQTQVSRVIPKFEAFIAAFPDEAVLANASLADVLKLWQGLGYNRRAKYLHDAAKMIIHDFGGTFPEEETDIMKLPGVGKNTAGAIRAYSFNQPSIYIETNIRTVYIHHFFADNFGVSDSQIVELLKVTVPGYSEGKEQPDKFSHKFDGAMRKTSGLFQYGARQFYWALMDYGSWLKANGVRNNSRSRHYKKQASLHGSVREVRGQIVALLSRGDFSEDALKFELNADTRFTAALDGLLRDGLVSRTHAKLHLTK